MAFLIERAYRWWQPEKPQQGGKEEMVARAKSSAMLTRFRKAGQTVVRMRGVTTLLHKPGLGRAAIGAQSAAHNLVEEAEELSARAKSKGKAGDMEAALELFLRAAATAPNVAEHLSNAGAVLMYLKRPKEAMQYFEKALALDPDNAKIRKQVDKYFPHGDSYERTRTSAQESLASDKQLDSQLVTSETNDTRLDRDAEKIHQQAEEQVSAQTRTSRNDPTTRNRKQSMRRKFQHGVRSVMRSNNKLSTAATTMLDHLREEEEHAFDELHQREEDERRRQEEALAARKKHSHLRHHANRPGRSHRGSSSRQRHKIGHQVTQLHRRRESDSAQNAANFAHAGVSVAGRRGSAAGAALVSELRDEEERAFNALHHREEEERREMERALASRKHRSHRVHHVSSRSARVREGHHAAVVRPMTDLQRSLLASSQRRSSRRSAAARSGAEVQAAVQRFESEHDAGARRKKKGKKPKGKKRKNKKNATPRRKKRNTDKPRTQRHHSPGLGGPGR